MLPDGTQQANGSTVTPQDLSERSRRSREHHPLDQHINKALCRHEWISKDRNWTRQELDRERADFFDTRVTGRPEIWQTVHVALQMLWEPNHESNDDGMQGLGTAQSILSAAEISLPTGDLSSGVYDSFGNYYQLPQWVVANPSNMIRDNCSRTSGNISALDKYIIGEGDDEPSTDDAEREGAGAKGRHTVLDQVTVRARLSETGLDVDIIISKFDTVRNVTKAITSKSALSTTKMIRLAYMGKILKENMSLEAQGWQNGYIVNALVFDR
ncbi:Ubiquitin supergroup [Drechmeria coniospora]|uniref:Ubiquitin supergroup n=1 Tax=Drechmeria coniospora TaxID=98403 RepID=A0A151GFQ7_DRECN|nr:Ubiquitin supergroup [Drechmeria coniospora]KYK55929.1 Ubiquitin supergroup [Drechmeria coniospora]